jgi:hypothetical protein
MAEDYVAKRSAVGVKDTTVNREMTVLKHMVRRAVEWENLSRFLDAQGRPLKGLPPLKEPPGRNVMSSWTRSIGYSTPAKTRRAST